MPRLRVAVGSTEKARDLAACEPAIAGRWLGGEPKLGRGGQIAFGVAEVQRRLEHAKFLADRAGRLVTSSRVAPADFARDGPDWQRPEDRCQRSDGVTDPLRIFDSRRMLAAVDVECVGDSHLIRRSWADWPVSFRDIPREHRFKPLGGLVCPLNALRARYRG